MSYAPTSQGMLAVLEPFIQDASLSEILINRPGEVWIETQSGMQSIALPVLTQKFLQSLFQLIASENRQRLDEQHPILSGSLLDGSRIQLVLPPVSLSPLLSIRKKVIQGFLLQDYSVDFFASGRHASRDDDKTHLPESEQALLAEYEMKNWRTFIERAILLKKNIVISGGTSSGKTTFLNACLRAIPAHERLIILEDTRELMVTHENSIALLASKGEQGTAKITQQDLVQASLRLRPDRIIVGETRGKEILDFLGAASTGHDGSLTSIHASNPEIAWMRMAQMYKLNNVPSMTDEDIYRELKAVIDIIIQLEKTPTGRQIQSVYYRQGAR